MLEQYVQSIQSWQNKKILVIGDVMLDKYCIGSVARISPEAPVPIVHIQKEQMHLGGAGNVAQNIAALGCSPILISVVGEDEEGVLVEKLLQERAIQYSLYKEKGFTTTVKTRVLGGSHHLLRIDREERCALTQEQTDTLLRRLMPFIEEVDIVVVSDYAKGVVTQYCMEQLKKLCSACSSAPRILVDPKVDNVHAYSDVFMVTPNEKELLEIFSLQQKEKGQPESLMATGVEQAVSAQHAMVRNGVVHDAGIAVRAHLQCTYLLATLGAEGMALFSDVDNTQIPTYARTVYDVTGAGDTVVATLACALANDVSVLESVVIANYAAGYTVSRLGVASVSKNNIITAIEEYSEESLYNGKKKGE